MGEVQYYSSHEESRQEVNSGLNLKREKERETEASLTPTLHISYRSSWPMPGPSWTSGGGSSSVYVSVVPGA
ncbi:hypothetical protein PFLUV_G00074360 [Perca fluviatilis]|uniref:Uncharacterized protein n=1 Tax=Perca fluviatilis TaxID=8168 RepID=A0A6A5F7M2_PERFL|nr:hypothetical protein PFLUV_G00074360 [Perca fluviatilis]